MIVTKIGLLQNNVFLTSCWLVVTVCLLVSSLFSSICPKSMANSISALSVLIFWLRSPRFSLLLLCFFSSLGIKRLGRNLFSLFLHSCRYYLSSITLDADAWFLHIHPSCPYFFSFRQLATMSFSLFQHFSMLSTTISSLSCRYIWLSHTCCIWFYARIRMLVFRDLSFV